MIRAGKLALLLSVCNLLCSSAKLEICPVLEDSRTSSIGGDCIWPAANFGHQLDSVQALDGLGVLPALTLDGRRDLPQNPSGKHLTVKQLVLRNATLAPATAAATTAAPAAVPHIPRLLPLGLVPDVPSSLTLVDVLLAVNQRDFEDYLALFSRELSTSSHVSAAGARIHTDNSSFIHIPYWSDNVTEVFALTLFGPKCDPRASSSSVTKAGASAGHSAVPACNVHTAGNKTLVQILRREAAIRTGTPLAIRVTSNVTLGPGLTAAVSIQRPVILIGMTSAVTSVDLGMEVNILNVTSPGAQLHWQGLVLENLAPGDATSSLVAAPFSTSVSTNVWAIYCNRSAGPCLHFTNVTLVVPQQDEINYMAFMFTMYISASASLRQLAAFYDSDLKTKVLQFAPGPGSDTLTIFRLVNLAWDYWYVTCTLRTLVAPKLPLPRQAFKLQIDRPGPLVQAVRDCAELQAAVAVPLGSNRTRIWTLLNNISLAESGTVQCAWPNGNLSSPTELHGELVGAYAHQIVPPSTAQQRDSAHVQQVQASGSVKPVPFLGGSLAGGASTGTGATLSQHLAAAAAGNDAPAYKPNRRVAAVSFGFVPGLFELPDYAQDKYFKLADVTLTQLPQQQFAAHGGSKLSSSSSSGMRSLHMGQLHAAPSHNGGRRLLQHAQEQPGVEVQQRSGLPATPPGIWTILLWPITRSLSSGAPLMVSDSQIFLPQPEWDTLAREAQRATSFVLQLTGAAQGMTFTGVSLSNSSSVLHVGMFNGPGMLGQNLWLLPEPATSAADVLGYNWPSELLTGAGSSDGASGGSLWAIAVGVIAAVLGLLVVVLVTLAVRWRKRKARRTDVLVSTKGLVDVEGWKACEQQQQQGTGVAAASAHVKCQPKWHADSAGGTSSTHSDLAGCSSTDNSSDEAAAAAAAAAASSESRVAGTACSGSTSPTVEQTIATSLARWNQAVSNTTMQLMQQRMQRCNLQYTQTAAAAGSGSSSGSTSSQQRQQQHQVSLSACAAGGQSLLSPRPAGQQSKGQAVGQDLILFEVVGVGSYGSVYAGSWRGKRVAVKLMDLNNSQLLASGSTHQQQQLDGQQQRQQQQQQRNSVPHMAVMEAVVTSAMSHPNVVQVYTYMLTPLMLQNNGLGVERSGPEATTADAAAAAATGLEEGSGEPGGVFGFQLRLVMEFCDKGTLRESLDRRLLPCLPESPMPDPGVVLSISHDVAAAMLHLHTEGIVHGDLKAGNVLLTVNTAPGCQKAGSTGQGSSSSRSSAEVWLKAGSMPLVAKVADFGLALPLGPQDTHATMMARGTPTHMAPEVFMLGHVSKASDVYAFGILLYETITGRRAFAGTPTPLLAHEVAVGGLRPNWPEGVSSKLEPLCRLAELCWRDQPGDRPAFQHVLASLEGQYNSTETEQACDSSQQRQQQQQELAQQHACRQLQQIQPRQPLLEGAAQTAAVARGAAETLQGPSPKLAVQAGAETDRSQNHPWSNVSYGGGQHKGYF